MGAHSSRYGRGVALILVLWFVVLLGVLAMGLSTLSRNSALVARQLTGATKARYLAEGGIQMVLANLLMAQAETKLVGDGETFDLPFHGDNVQVTLWDESGKININAADEALLVRLFQAIDLPLGQSEELAAAIIDWRDEDSLLHINGAEDDDYRAAGLPYESNDSPFLALAELRKVLGMNKNIYRKIEPYITIYSNNEGVNPAVASALVLLAISTDDDNRIIEDYVEQRRRNQQDGVSPPQRPNNLDDAFLIQQEEAGGGEVFTISAFATTEYGYSAGQSMVFILTEDIGEKPIKTLDLQPYALAVFDADDVDEADLSESVRR